ncbi:MAG: hypothetical protein E7L17_14500 [Clostridium sp.]|uniref:hypothetical protein n=1 Tax=Clostridium sp. TaxID=1506 RepID=UPI002908F945|nr:hypothetical protein [Clostridium sp.]MDU7339310.1 hypothetical protein [Clostridium sp.]
MTFTIPYPHSKSGKSAFCKRFGFNAVYAGKHWSKRREDAEYLHGMVKAALLQQGIRHNMFDNPVSITFYWDDRLDIDNHAYMGKLFVDGIKGYLLQDDDRRYLREVHHKFHDGGNILVEITPA